MARIFVGLVKCGAWGCFDEFNRLEEATLSAVSMQIQPIQTALKFGHGTVKLMDEEVSNNNKFFAVCFQHFITVMNIRGFIVDRTCFLLYE
jgi:hypothetical protein